MAEETKICADKACEQAGIAQPISNFGIKAQCKDGHNPYCKICQARRMAESRMRNREQHIEKRKPWIARQVAVKRLARARKISYGDASRLFDALRQDAEEEEALVRPD
jgi:hypothetical protein